MAGVLPKPRAFLQRSASLPSESCRPSPGKSPGMRTKPTPWSPSALRGVGVSLCASCCGLRVAARAGLVGSWSGSAVRQHPRPRPVRVHARRRRNSSCLSAASRHQTASHKGCSRARVPPSCRPAARAQARRHARDSGGFAPKPQVVREPSFLQSATSV